MMDGFAPGSSSVARAFVPVVDARPNGSSISVKAPRSRRSHGRVSGDAAHTGQKNAVGRCTAAWNFRVASLYNAAMLRIIGSAAAHVATTDGRARTRGLALAVLFSSMAFASTAHAQTPSQPAPAAPAAGKATGKSSSKKATKAEPKSSAKPTTNKAGNKVISLDDEFLVEGKLEKPSAFYVLRRSSTDYDWARLDAVFTPLVLESVQDPLF